MRYILIALFALVVGCKDVDNDGYDRPADCGDRIYHDYSDPTDPYDGTGMDGRDIYPDAPDQPYDGIDQNCWGDDDFDADHDGVRAEEYGGEDCNDFDPNVYPEAEEFCDGVDNDCNGAVDETAEPDAAGIHQYWWDHDGDGYSGDRETVWACEAPAGYSTNEDEDCDDADASVHPGAIEYCDGVDNDCDGTSDGDNAVDPATWYFDYDGDGYSGDLISLVKCEAALTATEAEWYLAATPGDCDDLDAEVWQDCPAEE